MCGDNVVDMCRTYQNCLNITGIPVCGNNVTNMFGTYRGCVNLSAGDQYWYSKNIANASYCFANKNNSRRYNIHCYANSLTFNKLIISNTKSIVGATITWTNAGAYRYNTVYNIYIYPDL